MLERESTSSLEVFCSCPTVALVVFLSPCPVSFFYLLADFVVRFSSEHAPKALTPMYPTQQKVQV